MKMDVGRAAKEITKTSLRVRSCFGQPLKWTTQWNLFQCRLTLAFTVLLPPMQLFGRVSCVRSHEHAVHVANWEGASRAEEPKHPDLEEGTFLSSNSASVTSSRCVHSKDILVRSRVPPLFLPSAASALRVHQRCLRPRSPDSSCRHV
jgi:hypothetical protein